MGVILCKILNIGIAVFVILGGIAWRMKTMGFSKTGVAPIQEIKCSCGYEIKGHLTKCPNCNKTLIPEHLQKNAEDLPKDSSPDESKVK